MKVCGARWRWWCGNGEYDGRGIWVNGAGKVEREGRGDVWWGWVVGVVGCGGLCRLENQGMSFAHTLGLGGVENGVALWEWGFGFVEGGVLAEGCVWWVVFGKMGWSGGWFGLWWCGLGWCWCGGRGWWWCGGWL